MKHIISVLAVLSVLASCATSTTTTTTQRDGKTVTVVTEKKVDGNVISNLGQLVLGGVLSLAKGSGTP